MKTKVFLAALAVAFSFGVMSCGGKKASDVSAADSTAVAQCDTAKACCKKDTAACCKQDSATCCQEKTACAGKGECKKAGEKK